MVCIPSDRWRSRMWRRARPAKPHRCSTIQFDSGNRNNRGRNPRRFDDHRRRSLFANRCRNYWSWCQTDRNWFNLQCRRRWWRRCPWKLQGLEVPLLPDRTGRRRHLVEETARLGPGAYIPWYLKWRAREVEEECERKRKPVPMMDNE